jgi:hypothetical protein
MSCIKIRKKQTRKVEVCETVRPDLWVTVCDECGVRFKMHRWCNDQLHPGLLKGTFDRSHPEKGGNGFEATVCSLSCAHELFCGGWKKLPDYRALERVGATLARVELGLTAITETEAQVVEAWEKGEPEPFELC